MENADTDVKSILKTSEYVHIELRADAKGALYVSKKYKAHTVADRKRNAAYSYMALRLFKERFADVLVSPKPFFDKAEDGEILMEYLLELSNAARLSFGTLPTARGFFERCYSLEPGLSTVETIYDSVVVTPRIRSMIDSGWPLRLGLKGDLYENLRHCDGKVILADVEGLAYEPYGLSELVLHAGLCASVGGFRRTWAYPISACPIAFQGLTREQAKEICIAAMEVLYNNMKTVPSWRKKIKSTMVQKSLRTARMTYYS